MREYLFLFNKVKRQIDWNGQNYTFTHTAEDKYHNETTTSEIILKGVYHQSTSYKSKSSKDGSVISSKSSPMILCLYDDGKTIQIGDKVKINDKDMFITGIENVQELNVAIQISLEVNE